MVTRGMTQEALRAVFVAELFARAEELREIEVEIRCIEAQAATNRAVRLECRGFRGRLAKRWAYYQPMIDAVRAAGWASPPMTTEGMIH
jgi:hypothetical protein